MKCIFCKQNSDNSKTVEHIIPEALGNEDIILKKGIVCDACNNYFGRKVERKLQEKNYFIHTKHWNNLRNKRNRIPSIKGIIGGEVTLKVDKQNNRIIEIEDEKIAVCIILRAKKLSSFLIVPIFRPLSIQLKNLQNS